MKKTKSTVRRIMAAALVLACLSGYAGSAQAAQKQTEARAAPVSSRENSAQKKKASFSLPDPARVLPDDTTVSQTEDVELELNGEICVFTQYTYRFSDSKNLTDNTKFITYKTLVQDEDLDLDYLYGKSTYSEYAIVYDEYLLGFFTKDTGEWNLYLSSSVELDSTSNSSKSSGSSSSGSSSFQNKSYGITVKPGETAPDTGTTTTRCDACGGSGICDACGGDGWADDIYYGRRNAFECDVCGETGECPVCDGEGVWIFD